MKYCSLKNPSLPALCLLLICCSLGLGAFGLAANCLMTVPSAPFLPVFFLLTGAFLCAGGVFSYACLTREYSVDPRGITLRLLRRFTVFHPWEAVTSIVLCDTGDRLTDSGPLPIVIRIAACEEKCGPFARPRTYNLFGGMDKWRTDGYAICRFRSIVYIDYTEDRLHEIAEAGRTEIKECWSDIRRRNIAYRQMNREG